MLILTIFACRRGAVFCAQTAVFCVQSKLRLRKREPMTAYEIALAAHNAAFVKFSPLRDAYRAQTIGDVDF
jgi:hypothetical protein